MIINGVKVETWAQAAAAEALVAADSFDAPKSEQRFQTNGQLEAFYVSKLMNTDKGDLAAEVEAGKAAVGGRNTFKRALARVAEARKKNRAFRTR